MTLYGKVSYKLRKMQMSNRCKNDEKNPGNLRLIESRLCNQARIAYSVCFNANLDKAILCNFTTESIDALLNASKSDENIKLFVNI